MQRRKLFPLIGRDAEWFMSLDWYDQQKEKIKILVCRIYFVPDGNRMPCERWSSNEHGGES